MEAAIGLILNIIGLVGLIIALYQIITLEKELKKIYGRH